MSMTINSMAKGAWFNQALDGVCQKHAEARGHVEDRK
jgi:hypothetical protein